MLLLMGYWDGMVSQGIQPTAGYRVCKDYDYGIASIIKHYNKTCQMSESRDDVPHYNFQIIIDRNL